MPWSMKTERNVAELADGDLGVEQIASKLKIEPQAVIKIGRRLGIYFPPLKPKQNGRRKARI
jgi:hypothetical protein